LNENLQSTRSAGRHRLRTLLFLASLACMGLSYPATAGAATASWGFEPPSFDFGVRLPDEGPTVAKAFELKNTGEVKLAPELVSVTDRGESGFELAHNGCTKWLAPGDACQIEINFDPSSGGRKEATLAVESSSGVAAAKAQLSGSGGEPVVVIEPQSVTFDTVTIPAPLPLNGPQRTVKVTNAGSADLSIEGLGYDEGAPAGSRPNFSLLGELVGPGLCVRATLSPGSSCSINLAFVPYGPGTYHAELQLKDNAAGSPQGIQLFGTAVAQTLTPTPPRLEASRPKLARKPPPRTRSRTATFEFSANSSPGGFVCRLRKHERFRPCTSPVHLRGLRPGLHLFAVRGLGTYSTPGPISSYHWRILR
jgi:hypothetical protein